MISNEIKNLFSNSEMSENPMVKYEYDKTGDSYEHQANFILNGDINDDHIRIGCTN